ncbi:MAG: NAD(P)(+) transhydrogenase (Re/Si-specific) subunit beta [Chloroflexota bacterium]|nr:NAD(P)(+) transhydrogenase (Re/Si-specific) subunit beta [Chloroflexota bacterium]
MIESWQQAFVDLCYLAAAISFIVALKRLSSPATARQGNQLAMLGMALAVLGTFFVEEIDGNILQILIAMAIGGGIGYVASRRVQMTAMPQMVAAYNGMGGLSVALVSIGEFYGHSEVSRGTGISIVLGVIIGAISFTGSVIAFMKLQELIKRRSVTFENHHLLNAATVGAALVLGAIVVILQDGSLARFFLALVFLVSLVVGASMVLPIGGADMPVVIAILNSASGLGTALTGFALGNQSLIVAGTLVGASGSLLTYYMARAMNRSVMNVLVGSFGAAPAAGAAAPGETGEEQPIRSTTAEDVAVSLAYANRVIIVPGYGLAVAQAQHAVRELGDVLTERGVDVRYAIHPVAGRMPGHMNVLLAEANVPYDDLYEMEQINDDFQNTDVALVVGANDVTNPAARSDPSSPIYGMPVLNVDAAQNIVVLKRGMKPGFAGIENALFHNPKTSMLFGDAKESIDDLVAAVKAA